MDKEKKHLPDKMTKMQRLDFIKDLIAQGLMRWEIEELCMKEFKITDRTARKYLKIVYDMFQTSIEDKDVKKIILEYNQKAIKYEKMGLHKIAQGYLFQRDKILGLGIVNNNVNVVIQKDIPLFPDIDDINRETE